MPFTLGSGRPGRNEASRQGGYGWPQGLLWLASRYGAEPGQFVTTTDGACPFQLAISEDTLTPELKSTRSHCGPDQVCTANPAPGTAVTSRAEFRVSSSVTWPPASV